MKFRISMILFFVIALAAWAQPSFRYPATISVGGTISSLVAGDFNNDGRGDFAVTFGTSAAVFFGNPDGSITRMDLALPPGATYPTFIAFADVNGDGNADLLGRGYFDSNNGYFAIFGNGDGTFRSPVLLQPTGGVLAVADFNRDGFADLLVGGGSTSASFGFAVQLGHGDGTFSDPGPLSKLPAGPEYYRTGGMVIGDLNGDGFPDVAWNSLACGVPEVWLGNGDGSFRYIESQGCTIALARSSAAG